MTKKQKKMFVRILITAVMLIALKFIPITGIPQLLAFVCKGRSKIRFEGIIRQGKDKRTGPDPCMKKGVPFLGGFPSDQKTHAVDPAGIARFFVII